MRREWRLYLLLADDHFGFGVPLHANVRPACRSRSGLQHLSRRSEQPAGIGPSIFTLFSAAISQFIRAQKVRFTSAFLASPSAFPCVLLALMFSLKC
jgi:hypothetical protein